MKQISTDFILQFCVFLNEICGLPVDSDFEICGFHISFMPVIKYGLSLERLMSSAFVAMLIVRLKLFAQIDGVQFNSFFNST